LPGADPVAVSYRDAALPRIFLALSGHQPVPGIVRTEKVLRFLELHMMFVRGLLWAAMAVAVGPDIMAPARAEPRTATAIEVPAGADVPASPVLPIARLTPDAAGSASEASIAANTAAKPAAPPKPAITLHAKVDLTHQTLVVTDHGKTVGTWKISSGVSEELATPRGLFQPEWMAKLWHSRTYDDAPMPHAVFFKNGAAIHATQALGSLGRPASHGCVRLAPAHAETFYKLVQRHGLAHTRVHVYGTPNYARPLVAQKPVAAPRQAVNTGFGPGVGSGFGVGSGTSYRAAAAPAWYGARQPVRYANSSPFSAPLYPRLPVSAARVR
jgi:lipoprotein-anchoring transpeptidase ErfK/SrfK